MPSLLYAVPLTAVISLVYCTTRYELPARIWTASATMFVKTTVALAVLYTILWFLSR
ncbi:MAG: hypothetical protein Fues2KO_44920 [Fuerstiella sp.]|jgi:hypothetical protein